jgi:hypothetical protein
MSKWQIHLGKTWAEFGQKTKKRKVPEIANYRFYCLIMVGREGIEPSTY